MNKLKAFFRGYKRIPGESDFDHNMRVIDRNITIIKINTIVLGIIVVIWILKIFVF